ncbi:MAG: ABC transporter ATP-binding protein [Candidatus Heimdallarchaeota archaeon]|nr:ABC transporter ATP-binding protein [Candidatus Heimdallarchaeota archaeon]
MGWIYSGLEFEGQKRDYTDWMLLKKIMKLVVPYKFAFTLTIVVVLINTAVNLVTPLVFTDAITSIKNNEPQRTVYVFALGFFILYLLQFLFYFLNNFAMAKLIPEFMVDLRTGVFNSIQKQDLKFFDKKISGRLTSRVGSDAAESANIIMLMATFGGNILLIIISFVILFSVSFQLALLMLIIVPFVIGFTWIFRRIARKLSSVYRKTIAGVNAAMAESVEGISIAKSFGREQETLQKFQEVNQNNVRAGFRQSIAMEFIFPTLDILSVIGIWLIIQYGGQWAIMGQYNLTPESLYLFILYLDRFFFPLMQLSTFYSQMQAGFAAYERIAEVMDTVPEVHPNPEGRILEKVNGDIKFINTTFGYEENEPILKEFNLHIKSGEKLAIVGATGAGKTTITNIITRFYEFQDGEVKIDDYDIRSLNLEEYRKSIGLVQQDPFLFSGTVEENIRYGYQEATDEELNQAITAVHADEFLQYMPNGLQTEVGERGGRLSTGQRQLVTLARALLSDPKIIIMDEATSSVDAYTEAVIQEALENLFKDRTSIVIAHRLSTVVKADRIIVLDQGKIIEEGSHKELMEMGGKYQELYETYFKHQAFTNPITNP